MGQFEPIVINVKPPRNNPFSRLPNLPKFGPQTTKLIVIIAAVVISITMVATVALSILANNKDFKKSHGLTTPQEQLEQTSGTEKSENALPGGGVATGVGGTTGTNSPEVTITAEPASVQVGKTTTLKWSVTNNPTSCTASDDWSGDKPASGSETSQTLSNIQTYLFTLTCKTATGTGFATVSVSTIQTGGTGGVGRPTVTLAGNPNGVYTGESSTLSWTSTNNPTSCTASGDWSGTKSGSGAESTGALTSAKTYTYTITCQNSAGSGYATTTVLASDPPPDLPIVTISSSPVSPVPPGTSVTLTWNTTNNPTSCTASGDWSGAKSASGSQSTGPLTNITTYNFKINCSNASGGTFDSVAMAVIPDPPSVSLTTSPSSVYTGASSTLTWSATNSPTSCTASGDWSGAKSASGSQSTGALNTVKTYYYSLSCTNAGGTGYTNNVPVTVTNPPAPVVTISASPISTTTGGSSNLTWSATNSPTSCTASGDWSGAKSASGSQSTGALNTVKTYSYTLQCSNAGGTGSATTTVNVSSGGGAVSPPVVTVSLSPTSIGTGSSSTISWSATNNPSSCTASNAWSGSKSASGTSSTGTMNAAGTFTYTLSCTNSAGSSSASAALTVIAIPVISISVSPASINTGSSSTITWSATNSPSSCTAGGSWSGSKAASGSQSSGTINTAGSYIYSLSCTNSGGTGTGSATLTVSNPAPVYCSGRTPCYGPNDLAAHASPGNCWGWNNDWVINITSFRPSHPGGIRSGSTSTIESASATCNHDIHAILAGSAAISGYRDSGGSTTHSHNSSTTNNGGSSQLAGYRVGYYDATKP